MIKLGDWEIVCKCIGEDKFGVDEWKSISDLSIEDFNDMIESEIDMNEEITNFMFDMYDDEDVEKFSSKLDEINNSLELLKKCLSEFKEKKEKKEIEQKKFFTKEELSDVIYKTILNFFTLCLDRDNNDNARINLYRAVKDAIEDLYKEDFSVKSLYEMKGVTLNALVGLMAMKIEDFTKGLDNELFECANKASKILAEKFVKESNIKVGKNETEKK